MQQPEKWNGFGKVPYSWDSLLTQELINLPDMGLEGSVKNTAEVMFSYIDKDAVRRFVEESINRLGITERNAEDAYRVLLEYWKVNKPDYDPCGDLVESSPSKVTFKTGHTCQFCVKPVMTLENVEFYCNIRFKYGNFDNPVYVLLTEAVNPNLKWELDYFRKERYEPCRYSIVLEEEAGEKN